MAYYIIRIYCVRVIVVIFSVVNYECTYGPTAGGKSVEDSVSCVTLKMIARVRRKRKKKRMASKRDLYIEVAISLELLLGR